MSISPESKNSEIKRPSHTLAWVAGCIGYLCLCTASGVRMSQIETNSSNQIREHKIKDLTECAAFVNKRGSLVVMPDARTSDKVRHYCGVDNAPASNELLKLPTTADIEALVNAEARGIDSPSLTNGVLRTVEIGIIGVAIPPGLYGMSLVGGWTRRQSQRIATWRPGKIKP